MAVSWQSVMLVADSWTPIRRQDICNHRDDVARSVGIRCTRRNDREQDKDGDGDTLKVLVCYNIYIQKCVHNYFVFYSYFVFLNFAALFVAVMGFS